MPAHTRNKRIIEENRSRIAQLYLKGYTQFAIAQQMGMTRELVRYDIHAIRDEWRKSSVFDFNLKIQEELHRIDMIEAEMWDAWERSKNPRDITSTRSKRRELQMQMQARSGQQQQQQQQRIPVDSTNEANKRTEQRDPQEAYMARISWCVEMRCKLLGLIAPTEVRHSGTVTTISEVWYEEVQGNPDARLMVIGGGGGGGQAPALEAPERNGHTDVAEMEPDEASDEED